MGKQTIPRLINNDPSFHTLNLRSTYLSATALTLLCEALVLNSTVTSVDLSFCRIGDVEMQRLCEMLKKNFTLNSLTLYGNQITDVGAQSLGEVLEMTSSLTELDLTFNSLGERGMSRLREALIWNQTLTYLNLEYNDCDLDNIYEARAEDYWIVRKNQTLYNLLVQYLEI